MTVKELKNVIEKLPDDFEIVVTTDLISDRPFNFYDLENVSIDIGYSSKVVHFFGDLNLGEVEDNDK